MPMSNRYWRREKWGKWGKSLTMMMTMTPAVAPIPHKRSSWSLEQRTFLCLPKQSPCSLISPSLILTKIAHLSPSHVNAIGLSGPHVPQVRPLTEAMWNIPGLPTFMSWTWFMASTSVWKPPGATRVLRRPSSSASVFHSRAQPFTGTVESGRGLRKHVKRQG